MHGSEKYIHLACTKCAAKEKKTPNKEQKQFKLLNTQTKTETTTQAHHQNRETN
jgi:hypothetical protein